MPHPEDDELVMHAYGEGDDAAAVEAHLATCAGCRERLADLRRDLSTMSAIEVPERGDDYGAQVWARLQPKLATAARRRPGVVEWLFGSMPWPRLALAGGVAALVLVAFVAGRYTQAPAPAAPAVAEASPAVVKERILLVAVGDHLERSRMVLAEILNQPDADAADLIPEQAAAEDLVATNRLYRQTALESGHPAMASTLEELERVLVEIANGRSTATTSDLSSLRERIESQGLIFKVTILGTQVRQRQQDVSAAPATGSKSST
jgi:hypothetical protein